MKYLRELGTVIGTSVGALVVVGATVGACGGSGETTGSTGSGTGSEATATGTGGGATSSGTGMGGGTTGAGGATSGTSTGTGGMPIPGYDCSAPVGSVPPLKLTQVASEINRPVLLKSAPGDNSRMYVVGQDGKIWIIKDGAVLPTPFLDISADVHQPNAGDERGLLGLAFHPSYEQNGRFFVYYTDNMKNPGDQHVVEHMRSAGDPELAAPGKGKVILDQPDTQANHNGGGMEFSPKDGFLYIGTGDGGGADDKDGNNPPQHAATGNGQSLATLFGKLLRIDVDSASPYAIPAGNMTGQGVKPEIWDYGLRNPWRFSFDACTSDIYIGDVGQNKWEEIDVEPAGQGKKNYGWRAMEANACFDASLGCDLPSYTPPVAAYAHGPHCSVTGGFVYRGKAIPGLRGTYFYGDYCSGKIWTLTWANGIATDPVLNNDISLPKDLVSFGQDNLGEVYVINLNGTVFRIDAQ